MPDYYFNLPPIDDLNPFQKEAVYDSECIILSGGPGTGKSVVSLWRHILNHQRENPIRSQLLTYTTSLALYLKKCCEGKSLIASQYTDSCINWYVNYRTKRDEIIVDEAQDMPIFFYEKQLPYYTKRISYGADDQQLIGGMAINGDGTYNLLACSPEAELKKLFNSNTHHKLGENYRSTFRIISFVKELFKDQDDFYIPSEILEGLKKREGQKPRLFISNGDFLKQDQAINQIIQSIPNRDALNIAILTPFADYFENQNYNARYYFELLQNRYDCSYYTNEKIKATELKNIHITTFKSAKGLEFDHVIIPNFQLVYQKFRVVSWKDFYVGLTRSKSGLFLVSDSDFASVSKNYIEKEML
jgi:superfamily I DNA/RNA helicase